MSGTAPWAWQRNLLLAALALALATVPLLVVRGAAWRGADQRTVDVIKELRRDYEPWFAPVFTPRAWERYLFGLQALVGTGAAAGAVGWLVGRRRAQSGTGARHDLAAAGAFAAAGAAVAVALLFVRTEFGELQAFVSAVQGVGLGLSGFFAGYPLGRRSAARAAPARGAAHAR